jgi:hypothetical protein
MQQGCLLLGKANALVLRCIEIRNLREEKLQESVHYPGCEGLVLLALRIDAPPPPTIVEIIVTSPGSSPQPAPPPAPPA